MENIKNRENKNKRVKRAQRSLKTRICKVFKINDKLAKMFCWQWWIPLHDMMIKEIECICKLEQNQFCPRASVKLYKKQN